MSMLLMLVMLGLFISSSRAVTCYVCGLHSDYEDNADDCENPTSSTLTCDGDVCVTTKIQNDNGLFAALYYCIQEACSSSCKLLSIQCIRLLT